MGEVHEVEDRLLGKRVALKTLNARFTGNREAMERLKSEVSHAHKVTHPNVCRIFDLGVDHGVSTNEADGLHFLTMEYLAGETLARFMRRRGAISAGDALPLLKQIAAGLAAAHEAGVIHRDLKGENVMLVRQANGVLRVVITDFGLAGSVIDESEACYDSGHFSGTIAYAAPERLAGRPATPASDVYSFGLLVLQVRTGRSPSPLGEHGEFGLEPAWAELVKRATSRSPDERHADGQALLTDLHALGHRRWRSRRRVAALAVGVSAAFLIGGANLVEVKRPQPGDHPVTEVAAASEPPSDPVPVLPAVNTAHEVGPPAAHPPLRPLRGSRRRRATEPPRIVAIPTPPAPLDDIVREIPADTITATGAGTREDTEIVDPFASTNLANAGDGR